MGLRPPPGDAAPSLRKGGREGVSPRQPEPLQPRSALVHVCDRHPEVRPPSQPLLPQSTPPGRGGWPGTRPSVRPRSTASSLQGRAAPPASGRAEGDVLPGEAGQAVYPRASVCSSAKWAGPSLPSAMEPHSSSQGPSPSALTTCQAGVRTRGRVPVPGPADPCYTLPGAQRSVTGAGSCTEAGATGSWGRRGSRGNVGGTSGTSVWEHGAWAPPPGRDQGPLSSTCPRPW